MVCEVTGWPHKAIKVCDLLFPQEFTGYISDLAFNGVNILVFYIYEVFD
jgi:hypothetical protein